MENHESIMNLMDVYVSENEKFQAGNKSAGTRARKALAEMAKLAKERRAEIQQAKNEFEAATNKLKPKKQ